MPQTVPAFLKHRAARGLTYLLTQAEAISADDAFRGRRSDWPDQPWGIGQDGSIAGIVYHTAAWKQLTIGIFAANGKALARMDFDPANAPDSDDWEAILIWLRRIGMDWNSALIALPDSEFDELREWEGGYRITLTDYIETMIKHDIQHAAQIEYLRQLYAAGG